MTGFGRVEGGDGTVSGIWEAPTVNGKGPDVRRRLPSGYDALEPQAREAVAARLNCGNISLSLGIDTNRAAILLTVNRDARHAAMAGSLSELLDSLVDARFNEDARLKTVLAGLLDDIAAGVCQARDHGAAQPQAIRDRLHEQMNELLNADTPVPEERLAQEIALLMTKADIREELDRLDSHITAFRDLLGGDEVPGRRLGFLCQELLREANTLCSKSSDSGLTAIGLDMKVAIDRLREQVLNVE